MVQGDSRYKRIWVSDKIYPVYLSSKMKGGYPDDHIINFFAFAISARLFLESGLMFECGDKLESNAAKFLQLWLI